MKRPIRTSMSDLDFNVSTMPNNSDHPTGHVKLGFQCHLDFNLSTMSNNSDHPTGHVKLGFQCQIWISTYRSCQVNTKSQMSNNSDHPTGHVKLKAISIYPRMRRNYTSSINRRTAHMTEK